jgi:hypothetical protein
MSEIIPSVPSNAATRLRKLLVEAQKCADELPMPSVMLKSFQLHTEPPDQHDDLAAHCVMATRAEFDELAAQLALKGCPDELYKDAIRIRSVFANQYMGTNWGSLRGNISETTLLALAWASWLLGQDELQIDEEAQRKFLERVDQLILDVESGDLPPLSRSIALTHLHRVRRALLFYQVEGIAPLETEMADLGAQLNLHRDSLEQEEQKATDEGKTIIRRVGEVWVTVAQWVEKAEKVKKTAETAWRLGNSVHEMLHKLHWISS